MESTVNDRESARAKERSINGRQDSSPRPETGAQEHQTVTVQIPAGLSPLLQKMCSIRGRDPNEVITTALSIYLGGRCPKEERFFGKRHFSIPRSTFIVFGLPTHEWQRLSSWITKKDHVDIGVGSNGEVFLRNETKLRKRDMKASHQ